MMIRPRRCIPTSATILMNLVLRQAYAILARRVISARPMSCGIWTSWKNVALLVGNCANRAASYCAMMLSSGAQLSDGCWPVGIGVFERGEDTLDKLFFLHV